MFGFLALIPEMAWMWYLAIITISLQGFFIFLAFLCTKKTLRLYVGFYRTKVAPSLSLSHSWYSSHRKNSKRVNSLTSSATNPYSPKSGISPPTSQTELNPPTPQTEITPPSPQTKITLLTQTSLPPHWNLSSLQKWNPSSLPPQWNRSSFLQHQQFCSPSTPHDSTDSL